MPLHQSGYRVYGDAALRQLKFIKRAQTLGFSLDESNASCACVAGERKPAGA